MTKKPKLRRPWREFLKPEEAAKIEAADRAKAAWLKAHGEVSGIMNRAVQRARYAARVR